MTIAEIWPKGEIEGLFPGKQIIINEFFLSDFKKIRQMKPNSIFEIAGFIWDQFVSLNEKVNPMKYMRFFQKQNPDLIDLLKNDLKGEPVHDAYYVLSEIVDDSLSYSTISEFLVLQIFPNFLHLSDIKFSNPYKPVKPGLKKLPFQKYEGLGLLKTLLLNSENYAKSMKIPCVSLTAATRDHFNLFERYGFKLAETAVGELAYEGGKGIPMVKPIQLICEDYVKEVI